MGKGCGTNYLPTETKSTAAIYKCSEITILDFFLLKWKTKQISFNFTIEEHYSASIETGLEAYAEKLETSPFLLEFFAAALISLQHLSKIEALNPVTASEN